MTPARGTRRTSRACGLLVRTTLITLVAVGGAVAPVGTGALGGRDVTAMALDGPRGPASGPARGPAPGAARPALATPSARRPDPRVTPPPTSAGPRPVAPVTTTLQTGCAARGSFDSVEAINRAVDQLHVAPTFLGADVGAGARLQDGRRLLLFGDTLRSPDVAGHRFVRNSMLLSSPGCLRAVLPAGRGAIVPDRARPAGSTGAVVGYWPMSVTVTPRAGQDLVTVMLQRVRTTGGGTFDFENLGPSAALFTVGRGGTPQLLRLVDLGPDSPDVTRPAWGAASVLSDGWLYLYGTAGSTEAMTFGRSLRVARVRPDRVLTRSEWTYWDGRGWSRSAAAAAQLIPAVKGTSQTLSVFAQGGRWYALSKRDDFLGRDLTVWTAPTPWGPFDTGRTVADLPSDPETGVLRYMPLAHPDLLPEPGTVVVSYSRNNTDLATVLADPFSYRPRFLRVRLPVGEVRSTRYAGRLAP